MSKALTKLQAKIEKYITTPRTVENLMSRITEDRLVITSYDPYLKDFKYEIEYFGRDDNGKRTYRIHCSNGFSWVLPTKEFLVMLATKIAVERTSNIYQRNV